jgi:hypothetical protein
MDGQFAPAPNLKEPELWPGFPGADSESTQPTDIFISPEGLARCIAFVRREYPDVDFVIDSDPGAGMSTGIAIRAENEDADEGLDRGLLANLVPGALLIYQRDGPNLVIYPDEWQRDSDATGADFE